MNRKTTLLLLGVLIIATFLRTYHLTSTPPGLYPDEAMNGSNALEAIRTGDFKIFYPENNGREGLFMNIQALSLKAFGKLEPWTLRFPSPIFGILTVLGTFFFVRELFRRDGLALFSAFLLATSFWHINFSRIGFRAITASFFLVWALYFFLHALREREVASTRKLGWLTISSALLGGLAFGLGFHSYIAYRAMPLLFLAFIPFFRKRPDFYKLTTIFILGTVIAGLPIGWYFLKHPGDFFGRTTQVAVTASANPLAHVALNTLKTIAMFNFTGDGNWRHNVAGRPELFLPVGILFWIGVVLALRAVAKGNPDQRFPAVLLFSWLVVSALPVVISDEGIPHALRAIIMVVPVMILAGLGGEWLYEKALSRMSSTVRRGILSVFVLLLAAEAYNTYFVLWARDPNVPGAFNSEYVTIGREIRSLPPEVSKYVVIEAGGGTTSQADPWREDGRIQQIPIPAETVMFLTDSFSPERQKERNIHYVLPGDGTSIPPEAKVFIIR